MKTLLLIPEQILPPSATPGPLPWATALSHALRLRPEEAVTVLTHTDAAQDPTPAVRLAGRVGGPDAALAMLGFLRCRDYDVVFTGGEGVGAALALLFRCVHRRPAHISVGHRLSGNGPRRLFHNANLKHAVDSLVVHTQAQRDFAEDRVGLPAERLLLMAPPVDDHFFRPRPETVGLTDQICAVGMRCRDYPTLQEALSVMPELNVKVAIHPAPVRLQDLPDDAPPWPLRDYDALRAVYAECRFVVVPLRDTGFAAGTRTILQAMAMGKAVIATRTEGQADLIIEGVTGLSVAPGDVIGWRQAITQLRADTGLCERLGHNARRWVEEHAALDRWAARISDGVRAAADLGCGPIREIDSLLTTARGVL